MLRALILIAALALLPSPPRAEIAPDVARSMTLCATPGLMLDDMAAQLGGMGWLKLPPQDRARAGRALAPYRLVFLFAHGLNGNWQPAEMAERLNDVGAREAEQLGRETPGTVTLIRSTGEVLQVSARQSDRADHCIVTLPGATADEAAAVLSVSLRDISRPPLHILTSLDPGSSPPAVIDWLSFAPDAFPGDVPDPLLSIIPTNPPED